MVLEEYRRKRDFDATREPAGGGIPEPGRLSYVIQKHAASRLHWDFRIELDGVMLSWAVPKGPSYDTADKRLAMHVEDHPIEYGGFEGTIPQGEYGGGTVMQWDRGWWEPFEGTVADAEKQVADGVLKMVLHGERLQGRWVLVRTHGYGGGRDSWLLIKEHDGGERPAADFSAAVEWTTSVATGRSMEEIAEDAASGADPSRVPGARRANLSHEQSAELATLVAQVPPGDGWLHEVKFDGYRILAFVENGSVRLVSRSGKDWTERFLPVADAVRELVGERNALLDGEVVVLKPDGTSSFQLLQSYAKQGTPAELHYYVFDLLHLDDRDLRAARLIDRKDVLQSLLADSGGGTIRVAEHVIGSGDVFFKRACELGLEGVVSKAVASKYRPGRAREWLKRKCLQSQEFVIVGYTDPGGTRSAFGALLLGALRGGKLVSTGRVGTGFSESTLAEILGKLQPLGRATPPVEDPPQGAAAQGIHWVEPRLVAQVAFAEWTSAGQLRHPTFLGLRDDKSADDVTVEEPAAPPTGPTTFAGVQITNPDKALWPDVGVTKIEVMRYYESVAELMLPHVSQRPLSLVRCPDGATGECFYQKHIENFPRSVATVDIHEPHEKRSAPYARVTGLASIIGLVQMGVLEIHTWGSRADDPDKPDRMVFDLDPDPAMPFSQIAATALLLRSELSRLGLASWLKSTGGKGLHVVVPIARTKTWEEVHGFSHAFVDSIVALAPTVFTSSMSKSKREGRIFIDYLRNSRGATSVAVYSTRARPGAPVSAPLAWEEIENTEHMPVFTIRTLPERISSSGFRDPWADMNSHRQSITKAASRFR